MSNIIIDMPTPELTKEVEKRPITQEEREQQELRDEADHLRDEYRERGLSRSDFIDKEYTQ